LVSRQPAFQLARPDIDVRHLLASTQLEQHFADPEVDVAIAHGREQAVRGVCSHALMTEEVTPVASPALVERERLRHPADLARVALLQVIPRLGQWRAWMAAAKLERVDPDRGPQFQSTPLALEAAMAGAGVAIANRRFVQPHLDSGRLVVAFDVPLPTDVGYYLLYRSARSDETSIAGFRDWLLSALDAERVPEVDGPHLDDAH
ncbi:MAG: hypothetical protein K0U93_18125, partial [Gammaproteobacteria bacterium]|nr:hypothetical protein [Gammaproteobacteria bacterium]